MKSDTSAEKHFSNSDMINELRDRISLEKNILFFNVSDCKDTVIDIFVVKDVFLKIGAPIPNSKNVRLGKIGHKPRPLKIICIEKSHIGLVLKSKNRRRDFSSFRNFDIALDWTSLQRKFYKNIRSQLSTRKNITLNWIYVLVMLKEFPSY